MADVVGGESMPVSSRTLLSIENAGNNRIGVVCSQATYQRDGILIGAHSCRTMAGQIEVDLGESAAAPAQRKMCAAFVLVDCDDDFLDQRAQQLLLVARRRGRRLPRLEQVGAEGKQADALVWAERSGAQLFATREFGLDLLELAQAALPFGLDATGDKAVVGVDGAIAALGALRLVARALDRETPLRQGAVAIGFYAFGGGKHGLGTERCERGKHGARHRRVDLHGADVEAVDAAAIDDALAGAVIAR